MSIKFEVFQDEDGWFVAKWDAERAQGGITTQARTLPELFSGIRDAVESHFDKGEMPATVTLHFASDPELEVREAAQGLIGR